ncbi:hypothetical protein Tco_0922338 [Tanacetum coccineum]|uniref:Uncharacterized protein n=1 Tax=Tanacetum coccineum TaxID=301880 RepID=A0ABQ5D4A2_9ASTR
MFVILVKCSFSEYDAEQNVPAQPPTRTDEHDCPRSQWLPIGKATFFFQRTKIDSKRTPLHDISGHPDCQVDEQWFDQKCDLSEKALADYSLSSSSPIDYHPSGDTVIDFVNELGYPEPEKTSGMTIPTPSSANAWGIVTQTNVDHAELIWEEFTQGIQTFFSHKASHKASLKNPKKKVLHLSSSHYMIFLGNLSCSKTKMNLISSLAKTVELESHQEKGEEEEDKSEKVIHESSSTSDSERTESETETAAPKDDKDQGEIDSSTVTSGWSASLHRGHILLSRHTVYSSTNQLQQAEATTITTSLLNLLLHYHRPSVKSGKEWSKRCRTVFKNQEIEKSPEEIIKSQKKEQDEEKQDSTYSIRSTDKVDLEEYDLKSALFSHMNKKKSANKNTTNYRLYHALMEALIADEDAMDKEVADKVKDHKRKHDSDDDEDDDDDEGPSVWIKPDDMGGGEKRSSAKRIKGPCVRGARHCDKERRIALSISNLKAACYLDFGLEELVPTLWVLKVNLNITSRGLLASLTGGLWRREFYINKHTGTQMDKRHSSYEYNKGMETRKWSEDDKETKQKDFIHCKSRKTTDQKGYIEV